MMEPFGWLVVGILIGSVCHTPTALLLISAGIIMFNNPLPPFLGSKRPQELIGDLISTIYLGVVRLLFERKLNRVYLEPNMQNVQETLNIQNVSAVPTIQFQLPNSAVARTIESTPIKRSFTFDG